MSLANVLGRYRRAGQRRLGRAELSHQRLDIQGLRMVAVLLVFSTHLFHWPRGGFVGVDIFFVISGFLITGNLLRTAETTGNVSFRKFYWNRLRRIVPAATAVLIVTYLACAAVFLPFRAHHVGLDALFAFFFVSNWRFAIQETDYFAASDAVSPLQHYWSLSIEEQFYFVWPALIFVIGIVVARKSWTHGHRMGIAGAVMASVVAASLCWALYETAVSPTWAYFNTFARVWELGIGALLATSVSALGRTPRALKAWLSWLGLGLIAASVFLISEESAGFPAPWALLPVAGSALVIAAGVGAEPPHQRFLRNPAAVNVGNISYSLYLVHWPVIVILGALVPTHDAGYYIAVLTLAFGLAVASYHFIENPLRYGNWNKARDTIARIRSGAFRLSESTGYRAVAVLALLTIGLTALALRPTAPPTVAPEPAGGRVAASAEAASGIGTVGAALRREIDAAISATQWPTLDPAMESAVNGPIAIPEVERCGLEFPDPQGCTWGSPTAATRIVLVGDSDALAYGGPLRELALRSDGKIQVRLEAMPGCPFVGSDLLKTGKQSVCPGRKQRTIDAVTSARPDVVVIANSYGAKPLLAGGFMTPTEWVDAMSQIVGRFRDSTRKLVWLSPPPESRNPGECYANRASVPADCLSPVDDQWLAMADAERTLAAALGGIWVDARPWMCSADGLCPAFVGSTPTKRDEAHITPAYGSKIHPALGEALAVAGVLPGPPTAVSAGDSQGPEGSTPGPLSSALQREIAVALQATEWPRFDPTIQAMIEEASATPPEVAQCGGLEYPDPQLCTWGPPTAPKRIVLVGDSVALGYGAALRDLALNSGGRIQLRIEAMAGCAFHAEEQKIPNRPEMQEACRKRKQHAVEVINDTRPDLVIVSNWNGWLGPAQWPDSMRAIVSKFRPNTKAVAWLSPPPGETNFRECYSDRTSVPADCISQVDAQWLSISQDVARAAETIWIDPRPWFCGADGLCPAFAAGTPTKHDTSHVFRAYAKTLGPVIGESMAAIGILPPP